MSMINKQIEGLRKMVKYHAGIYPDVVKALKDAADTIEYLSAKYNVLLRVKAERIAYLEQKLAEMDRPKGEWADVSGEGTAYKCSECGEVMCCNDNFCPNCGADMRGEECYIK